MTFPSSPHPVTAEKRPITLFYAELVDGEALSSAAHLAEEYAHLQHELRQIARQAVEGFRGYLVNDAGEGLLACFGHPKPVERPAQAAVNAALQIMQRVEARQWQGVAEGQLRLRVGVHTGWIFVDPDADFASSAFALAGLKKLATQVAASAPTLSVVITSATREQLRDEFECATLPGVVPGNTGSALTLYQVLSAKPTSAQIERVRMQEIRRLVARDKEMEQLLHLWQEAKGGRACSLHVVGEPGIGKSRLTIELISRIETGDEGMVLEFQGSPYLTHASFHPLIETLSTKICGFDREMSREERIERLKAALHQASISDPQAHAVMVEFLGLDLSAQPSALMPATRKGQIMQHLATLFGTCAKGRPALWNFNDAHWMDASTLEWLREVAAALPASTLVVIGTRHDEEALQALPPSEHRLDLQPLDEAGIREMALAVAERSLTEERLRMVIQWSGGIPLYVEELVADIQDHANGSISTFSAIAQAPPFPYSPGVPTGLQGLMASRLEKLGPARAAAHAAAVIGDDFTLEDVLALLDHDGQADGAATVQTHLQALEQAEILRKVRLSAEAGHGALYRFKHNLLREAAYESLGEKARASYHRRLAERLKQGAWANRRPDPGLVAQHLVLGDAKVESVPFWAQAVVESVGRSANTEAAARARKALSVIAELGPSDELRETEIMLTTLLGTSLLATRGFAAAEVGQVFTRAMDLIQKRVASAHRFPALWGLWVYNLMSGKLEKAAAMSREMLALARSLKDEGIQMEGLWSAGVVDVWRGNLKDGQEVLEAAVKAYRPEYAMHAFLYGQDPGVAARIYLAVALLFRGYTEEAHAHATEALRLARELDHAHTLAWALGGFTMIKLSLGDLDGALEMGAETVDFCTRHPQPFWLGSTIAWMGWAQLQKGNLEEARALLRQSQAILSQIGTALALPMLCAVMADVSAGCGDVGDAIGWVAKGRELAVEYQENISLPALWIVTGTVWLKHSPDAVDRAENAFKEALKIATLQGNRMREIQAAYAVAQMMVARGHVSRAVRLLAKPLKWFDNRPLALFVRPIREFFLMISAGENS